MTRPPTLTPLFVLPVHVRYVKMIDNWRELVPHRTQCQTFIAVGLFLSFPLFINQFSTVQVKSRQLTSYELSQYCTI